MARMLKLKEVSKETNLTYYFLRNACLRNEIPHIKMGNKFLINMDLFEEYLKNGANTKCKN